MIQQSFVLLDKVRQKTEQRIWDYADDWHDFLHARRIPGISSMRKSFYNRQLQQAQERLYDLDTSYFTSVLPQSEAWRLYDFFKEDALFLDIETSGYYGDITVIGLSDGIEVKTLVKGFNLGPDMLRHAVRNCKLLVTFNGASYDVPILRRYHSHILPNVPHIDLRHVCRRVGLTGGLKAIEKQLGISRAKEVQEIAGEDAVYLWQMWKATGEQEYLNLLVQYNEEDCLNLKTLAEIVIPQLWKKVKALC